ncbi:MAG TPA: amino acid permease [Candidatus Eremiobacteraceae bacterium]
MATAPAKPSGPPQTGLFITRSLDDLSKEPEGTVERPALKRALGPWALIALGLGNMVGAGIFATVGTGIHNYAGPAILISFLICAVASACAGLCYAEFSSMVPVAGSAYTYTYATLGEFLAWLIGWNLVLEYGMSAAPVATTFSANIQIALNSIGVHIPLWASGHYAPASGTYFDIIAFLCVFGFSILLTLGVRESAGTNSIIVIIKMAVLAFFVIIALPHLNPANFHPFIPNGWYQKGSDAFPVIGIIPGAFYAFFAFIGFDSVTVAAEEAKTPKRDVPIGVLGSLGFGAIFYTAVAIALIGLQPASHVDPNTPLPTALAAAGLGRWAWTAILGAVLGTSSVILTAIYGQSRIFMVMARDGLLPKSIATIHPKFRTPANMTLVMGVVVGIMAGTFSLDTLLSFVNTGTLSAFVLVCLGVLILRRTQPDRPRPFKTPWVPLLPVLGVALSTALMVWGTDLFIWIRFGIWMVIGLLIYFAYGYWHSEERLAALRSRAAK